VLMYERTRAEIEGLYGATGTAQREISGFKVRLGSTLSESLLQSCYSHRGLTASPRLEVVLWSSGLCRLEKPVDLIYLPDAPHLLIKPSERAYAHPAVVDWFCCWLGAGASQNSITAGRKKHSGCHSGAARMRYQHLKHLAIEKRVSAQSHFATCKVVHSGFHLHLASLKSIANDC
jgi:hypothetical protein